MKSHVLCAALVAVYAMSCLTVVMAGSPAEKTQPPPRASLDEPADAAQQTECGGTTTKDRAANRLTVLLRPGGQFAILEVTASGEEVAHAKGPVEGTMRLTCRKVEFAHGKDRDGEPLAVIRCRGGVVVDGPGFEAESDDLMYHPSDGRMTLESEGPQDAVLWLSRRSEGTKWQVAASEIEYFRSENRVEVEGAELLLPRPADGKGR
jgi:hypothetical protein